MTGRWTSRRLSAIVLGAALAACAAPVAEARAAPSVGGELNRLLRAGAIDRATRDATRVGLPQRALHRGPPHRRPAGGAPGRGARGRGDRRAAGR